MPDLLITRAPSREEAARAAHRQDEDDRLNEANRVYREQVSWALDAYLTSDDFIGEPSKGRFAVRAAFRRVERTLYLISAAPIVAPYARALREQAETITRREQDGEK